MLNRAARIARLRETARDRFRSFAPALFVGMFGDPAENPMGWPVSTIGETCSVVGGGTPRRSDGACFGGGVPWATPSDVTALNGASYIEKTKETLTEAGLRKSAARLVPARAVLMTSRATIGYTAIAQAPMATNQGFANLICGESLSPEYLSFFLRNRVDFLLRLANGTTFKEISKSTLKTVRIPLPPMDMQRRFAAVVNGTPRPAAAAEAARELASALTSALAARPAGEGP